MLFLLITCIIGAPVIADTSCVVKDVGFTSFDLNTFVGDGKWYEYYNGNYEAQNGYSCYIDQYWIDNGVVHINSSGIPNNEHERVSLLGTVQAKDNIMNITYPDSEALTGLYKVISTDNNSYSVIGACLKGLEEPFLWVGFRNPHPDSSTLATADNILKKIGNSLNNLRNNCP